MNQFWVFFLILFNLVFFFLWQVFITLFWLFFYSFFILFIIISSFFFWVFFFCFLQDFLPIKPVIIHFYILAWQVIKKMVFLLIHNSILISILVSHFSFLISHFSFTILLYHMSRNYIIFSNLHFYRLICQLIKKSFSVNSTVISTGVLFGLKFIFTMLLYHISLNYLIFLNHHFY